MKLDGNEYRNFVLFCEARWWIDGGTCKKCIFRADVECGKVCDKNSTTTEKKNKSSGTSGKLSGVDQLCNMLVDLFEENDLQFFTEKEGELLYFEGMNDHFRSILKYEFINWKKKSFSIAVLNCTFLYRGYTPIPSSHVWTCHVYFPFFFCG